MKVIELLNKIAKGELPPKKIIFNQDIWEFNNEDYDYHNGESNEYYDDNLFISGIDNTKDFLNSEVKIIEDKKIEKFSEYELKHSMVNEYILGIKINDLIDKIYELEENK